MGTTGRLFRSACRRRGHDLREGHPRRPPKIAERVRGGPWIQGGRVRPGKAGSFRDVYLPRSGLGFGSGMPSEETARRPRGLRNGVVAGLDRLYGNDDVRREISLAGEGSAAQAPSRRIAVGP